jgi:hypothetical protein
VFLRSGGFKFSLVDLPVDEISARVAEKPHRRSKSTPASIERPDYSSRHRYLIENGTAEAPDKTGRRSAMAIDENKVSNTPPTRR